MASLVLMGINRIVVTDGRISAKIMYDFQARDSRSIRKSAAAYDMARDRFGNVQTTRKGEKTYEETMDRTDTEEHGKDERSRDDSYQSFAKGQAKWEDTPIMTAMSAASEASDAALQTRAQLAGNVEVNFKSDYLPLDKMATPGMIAAIQGNSTPVDPNVLPSAKNPPPAVNADAGAGTSTTPPQAAAEERLAMAAAPRAGWTSANSLEAVRPPVRELLTAIPAFDALEPEERRALAANMVKVMSYIADPNGVGSEANTAANPAPVPASIARGLAQADTIKNFQKLNDGTPDKTGKDFVAGGVREGVEQFGALVQKVDFPKFVGGLIKNVFRQSWSLRSSRCAPMASSSPMSPRRSTSSCRTTSRLELAATGWPAATRTRWGSRSARGRARSRRGRSPKGPTATLAAKGENPEVRLAEISRDMNINPPITDLSDANAELRLVTAARLQMARQRQQLLSSMVMLGVNRIVVTDGSINAKVVFDMRGQSEAKASNTASMYDTEAQRNRNTVSASYGGWFSPVKAGFSNVNEQEHVATVASAVDESSTEKAEVKARLSGDVRVNFKSDYFPMEKLATPEMMSVIQGNSTPYNPNRPVTAPAAGGT
jgi:hypothetical protein